MIDLQHSSFQFIDYRLEEFILKRTSHLIPSSPPQIKFHHIVNALDIESGELIELGTSKDHKDHVVRLWIVVHWDGDVQPFDLRVNISGHFQCDDVMSPKDFAHFSDVLAPSLLFTQLRPIVHYMTTEANCPVMIPLINMIDSIKAKRKAEAEEAQNKLALDVDDGNVKEE